MTPTVSICMPTLNARRFLEPRMQSILGQTLADWELIVCDSHSADGTWEFLQRFAGDKRMKLYQVPREGLYAGWNECLRRATGEYIYVATADDTCDPTLLDTLTTALETWKKGSPWGRPVDIATVRFEFVDDTGRAFTGRENRSMESVIREWSDGAHVRNGRFELIAHLCIGVLWTSMTSVVFRRSLLERAGLFPVEYGPHGDLLWAVRTAMASDTVALPGRLATWRIHPEQATLTPDAAPRKRLADALRNMVMDGNSEVAKFLGGSREQRQPLVDVIMATYYESLGLNRVALRKSPLLVARRFGHAMKVDPMYAMKRLIRGFAWETGYSDPVDVVHGLCRELAIPYPRPVN